MSGRPDLVELVGGVGGVVAGLVVAGFVVAGFVVVDAVAGFVAADFVAVDAVAGFVALDDVIPDDVVVLVPVALVVEALVVPAAFAVCRVDFAVVVPDDVVPDVVVPDVVALATDAVALDCVRVFVLVFAVVICVEVAFEVDFVVAVAAFGGFGVVAYLVSGFAGSACGLKSSTGLPAGVFAGGLVGSATSVAAVAGVSFVGVSFVGVGWSTTGCDGDGGALFPSIAGFDAVAAVSVDGERVTSHAIATAIPVTPIAVPITTLRSMRRRARGAAGSAIARSPSVEERRCGLGSGATASVTKTSARGCAVCDACPVAASFATSESIGGGVIGRAKGGIGVVGLAEFAVVSGIMGCMVIACECAAIS